MLVKIQNEYINPMHVSRVCICGEDTKLEMSYGGDVTFPLPIETVVKQLNGIKKVAIKRKR